MSDNKSYRESFNLPLPPAGTEVRISYLVGVDYYIMWPKCPDKENVLYKGLKKKIVAQTIAKEKGWIVIK